MGLLEGSRTQRIVGWVLSALVFVFLAGVSAGGKFADWDKKEEMFGHIGFTVDQIKGIGVLEVIIAVLYIIPRTGFLGAILLTGYLGGATCTHVRVGDPNYLVPVVIGVVMWVGYALRHPIVFRLLLGNAK